MVDCCSFNFAFEEAAKLGCHEMINDFLEMNSNQKYSLKSYRIISALKHIQNTKQLDAHIQFILSIDNDWSRVNAGVGAVLVIKAEQGDWLGVKVILERIHNMPDGASVGFVLVSAVKNQQLDIVNLILKLTVANQPEKYYVSIAILAAAKTHQWDIVKRFLKVGEYYHPDRENMISLLSLAAKSGKAEIVSVILDINGHTAIYFYSKVIDAVMHSDYCEEILKYILDKNRSDKLISSAVGFAMVIKARRCEWDTVQSLLARSHDIPNQSSISSVLSIAIAKDNLDMVRMICSMTRMNMKIRIDIDIIYTAENGAYDMVSLILQLPPEQRPSKLRLDDAIYAAAREGHWNIVNLIITTLKDESFDYALHNVFNFAVCQQQIDMVSLILNTNITPCFIYVRSGLQIAVTDGNVDLMRLIFINIHKRNLLNENDRSEILEHASREHQWEIVTFILESEIDSDNMLSANSIANMFREAVNQEQWKIVQLVLDNADKCWYTQREIEATLQPLTYNKKWPILITILKMHWSTRLSDFTLTLLLRRAETQKQQDVIDLIHHVCRASFPSRQVVKPLLFCKRASEKPNDDGHKQANTNTNAL